MEWYLFRGLYQHEEPSMFVELLQWFKDFFGRKSR